MACRMISFGVLALLVSSGAASAQERVIDRGGYVQVVLPSDFRMRLVRAGGLTDPSAFADCAALVLNAQFFDIGSGYCLGATRVEGRTVSDDMRRNGRGIAWDHGPRWRLVSTGQVAAFPNGFSGGPTLVEGGRAVVRWQAECIRPNVHGAARRVALARSGDGATFVVITRDGYSLHGFADLLLSLGAREAVGLDGGSSSCLYVRGAEVVRAHRLLPSVLAFDFPSAPRSRPPAVARTFPEGRAERPSLSLVPIDGPESGRVVWLRGDLDAASQIEALGSVIACSPDIFNPGSADPIGALRSGGRPIGRHPGPPVGYSWAFGRGELLLRRCQGRPLERGSVGGCGPLLCWQGRTVPLSDQGYTRGGGMLGRARRLALAFDDGRVFVAASAAQVTPEEFARLLSGRFACAIGLSGGDHGLLYDRGRWVLRPQAALPYIFVFGPGGVGSR